LPDRWLGHCMGLVWKSLVRKWFHGHGGRLADGTARSAWEGAGLRQWHGQGPTSIRGRASMARACLWSSLPRLPPGPDQATRHFSRRVDLERRIQLSSPPLPSQFPLFLVMSAFWVTNTPFPFEFRKQLRPKCNARMAKAQSQGSGNGVRKHACHTNDETRVGGHHPAPISSGLS